MPNRWALPACLAVLLSFMPSGLLRRLLRPLGLRPASRRASLHARVSGQPSSPKARTPHGSSFPAVLHRVLHRSDLKPGRLIIVGDIHGTPEVFDLLRELQYDKSTDNLILAGDLVNKGPVSLRVLDAVPELGCHAVRGNHDDAVLGAWLAHRRTSSEVGEARPINPKYGWVANMTEQQAAVLLELPSSISIPSYGLVVVHAGLVPGVPLEQQDPWAMYKMRNLLPVDVQHTTEQQQQPGHPSQNIGTSEQQLATSSASQHTPVHATGLWKAVEKAKDGGEPWASLWRGPGHVFFGHDARRGLQLHPAATGLDTGCLYGKQLTAAVLPPLSELEAGGSCWWRGLEEAVGEAGGVWGAWPERAPTREELGVRLVSVGAARVYCAPEDGAGASKGKAGDDAPGEQRRSVEAGAAQLAGSV